MIKFCTRCTISSMRPRITFDENGVCSACKYAEYKQNEVDWVKREHELLVLLDKYRKGNGEFDVIVPVSGGKDGCSVAHKLKHKYGMTPLCVTWAPLLPTEIGRQNLEAFIANGFDVIQGLPNGRTTKTLARLSFVYMGDPFQPFIYGQTNFPLQMSVKYKIPLIFYGENGEVEYGGDMKNAFIPTREIEDHDKHYFSGRSPEFWTKHGMTLAELQPFRAPNYEDLTKNKTEIHFFGYYSYWDPQENFYYCSENTGFSANPERTEGTYSKYASLDDRLDGLHYYLSYIKFGIGRCTSDTAHEIRDNKITREEGVALVHRFDGEFPKKYWRESLEFMGLDEETALKIIESYKNPDVWDGDKLRCRVS